MAAAAEAPTMREPVHVPEVFATGMNVETIGGIAHIVFYQDRHQPPHPPERIVMARVVMEAFRLDNHDPDMSCVRGDCSRRVKALTI